jgi:hypothetical protein
VSARLVFLYARSRGLGSSLLAIGSVLVLGFLVSPVARLDVILWRDVVVDTADLIGVVPVVLLAPGFARSLGEAEIQQNRRLRLLRSLHVAVAIVTVTLGCSLVAAGMREGTDATPAIANGFAFLGLLLLSQSMNLPVPSWTVPVSLAIGMYFLGTNPTTREVRSWAWLLSDQIGPRFAINSGLLLAGAVSFVARLALTPEDLEA